ncbi:MAG: zinc dependent phospholipase C family protein [Eubacteriales bacterium]
MPAVMTHYQLGKLVLEQLNQKERNLINQHREMFDLGTQGPDLLFFYRPYGKNRVSSHGHMLHSEEAPVFLNHLYKIRKLEDKARTAYIMGVCCHYALDRQAHPYVNEYAPTPEKHQLMESSLDRLIINEYHISKKRYSVLPCKHIHVGVLKKVYSQVTKKELREAAIWMRCMNKILDYKVVMTIIERLTGKKGMYTSLCVPRFVEHPYTTALVPCFQKAILDACELIHLYGDKNTTEEVFRKATQHNFEGVVVGKEGLNEIY